MKKKSAFIMRYLTTSLVTLIYIGMVVIHLVSDSFILSNQVDLLVTMLPFILMGAILDYILSRNHELDTLFKVIAQLLPLGILILPVIATIQLIAGYEHTELINYLMWIFLSLPFFIASYEKDNFKKMMIYSIVGTGFIVVVYYYITTLTLNINSGSGAFLYFIAYILMFYTASGSKKMPWMGTILGVLNAGSLLLLRYIPITEMAKLYGWDIDIATKMEFLVGTSLVICILIRFFHTLIKDTRKKNR